MSLQCKLIVYVSGLIHTTCLGDELKYCCSLRHTLEKPHAYIHVLVNVVAKLGRF